MDFDDESSNMGNLGDLNMLVQTDTSSTPFPKKNKATHLFPVTIHQMLTAEQGMGEDSFKIGGKEAGQLTFVGVIRGVLESPNQNGSSMNMTYKIEDGTGSIEVKEWFQLDESEYLQQKRSMRAEGVHVRITGNLKSYKNKRHILATGIRLIDDFNEVTFHYIETIYAHLNQKKFLMNGHVQKNDANEETQKQFDENFANEVLQTIRLLSKPKVGTSFDEISSHLSDVSSKEKVQDAIKYLIDMTLIYTTINENNYALLDEGSI